MTTAAPRLGVAYVPTVPPERLRALAVTAENSGLDDLWVWEDCFKQSGIASAAAVLAWTERLRVGIGLMPAPLRNVGLVAMEIATLERMFPGRVVPGVGHGVQDWMGQVGGRVASPITLLREYAVALRSLLAGEEVTVTGRYVSLDRVRLDWPPSPAPPLMLGGAGPKSLALAGELGDQTLLGAALTEDEIAEACRIAYAAAGTSDHEVIATQIGVTGSDAQERLDREVRVWGREPGRGGGVAGDAAAIAASVLRLAGVGATTVMIQPTVDEPDLEGFVRFLGEEVQPLLRERQ